MPAPSRTTMFDDLWQAAPGRTLPTRQTLQAIAARCAELWEMPGVAGVRIRYNPRLRTSLGYATLEQSRVELNPRLLLEHPSELVPTLVHELAHLAVFARYGRVSPHGIHFRALMRAARLSPAATHDLPVEAVRNRLRRFLYLHRCLGCGASFLARRVRRDCYCRRCGPGNRWHVLRAPATPEGQALLEQARAGGRQA